MNDDSAQCPICSKFFPITELISHAENCNGLKVDDEDEMFARRLQEEENGTYMNLGGEKKNSSHPMDEDEALARKLMEEENNSQHQNKKLKQNSTQLFKCTLCDKDKAIDDIYTLDACTHKFCKNCLKQNFLDKLQTLLSSELTCPNCKQVVSARDLEDLLPRGSTAVGKTRVPDPIFAGKNAKKPVASQKATQRIIKELTLIQNSNPEKQGYTVEPVDDNLYLWRVAIFDFDKGVPLAQDLQKTKDKKIILQIQFPPHYPNNPPYIRVIRPRFQFMTGHVTIGGSICMELLTNRGWSPANTVESVILSIKTALIDGGARLDSHNASEYQEYEAKDAFDRMVRKHGWD